MITVINDLPDVLPKVETDEAHPAGNHVVIRVAEDEYLSVAHLQPNSIVVTVGDRVEQGQQIGLVGNSGNTSEPHLHIHLQDRPEFFEFDNNGNAIGPTDAVGLHLHVSNYLANGERVENGIPIGGQLVQDAE